MSGKHPSLSEGALTVLRTRNINRIRHSLFNGGSYLVHYWQATLATCGRRGNILACRPKYSSRDFLCGKYGNATTPRFNCCCEPVVVVTCVIVPPPLPQKGNELLLPPSCSLDPSPTFSSRPRFAVSRLPLGFPLRPFRDRPHHLRFLRSCFLVPDSFLSSPNLIQIQRILGAAEFDIRTRQY